MMDAKKLVVTYRQINEAVHANHEAAVDAARDAAAQGAPDDPLMQARFLAGLNAALAELEAAEGNPDVMSTPRHAMAAQLQSFIAEQAAAGNTSQPPAALGEGLEVKFDNNDWLGWMGSFFTWWRKIRPHDLPASNPVPTAIPTAYRVALISDWGTGMYGAPFSAKSIDADTDPRGYQLLLHLGDVYYSGTEGEINDRFLAEWPKRGGAVSRTLNGNHEMYTGGHAYFEVALKKFGQASSYFALRNEFWTLVCLDTAYVEHDLAPPQRAWLDQVLASNDRNQKVVFFSHHQPYSLLDSQGEKLVDKLGDLLLGGRVFAWYWGHEHRCVVYDRHPSYKLLGRCVGHGGFPEFRDKIDAMAIDPAEPVTGDYKWRRLDARNLVPGGIILDGPNPYVKDHVNEYQPHGYLTLEFDNDTLKEIYRLPDGTIVRQHTL
jgi:hypothetical protein